MTRRRAPSSLATRRCMSVMLIGCCVAAPAAAQVPLVSPQFGSPPQPTSLTVRVLAEAQPTVAFLERSSRLAVDHAGSKRLRSFARVQAAEQERAETALAAAAAPTPVGYDPLEAAAVGSATVDETAESILSRLPRILQTPGARAIAADAAIAQAARDDLQRLTALEGSGFDALYVASQIQGLQRLVSLYRDYVRNGDDGALRAFAVHELPRVRARVLALGRG